MPSADVTAEERDRVAAALRAFAGLAASAGVTVALEFHRAECEFLSGQVLAAEQRLALLAARTLPLMDGAKVAMQARSR